MSVSICLCEGVMYLQCEGACTHCVRVLCIYSLSIYGKWVTVCHCVAVCCRVLQCDAL